MKKMFFLSVLSYGFSIIAVIEKTTMTYFNAARTKNNKQVAQAIYSAIYSDLDANGKTNVAKLFNETFKEQPQVPTAGGAVKSEDQALNKLIEGKNYEDAFVHILTTVGDQVAAKVKGGKAQKAAQDFAGKVTA